MAFAFGKSLHQASKPFYNSEAVDLQHMREEFTVSSLGLCAWLVTWSESRHSKTDKQTASAILASFCGYLLNGSEYNLFELNATFDSSFSKCIRRDSQTKPCCCCCYHLRYVPTTSRFVWYWDVFIQAVANVYFDNNCFAAVGFSIQLLGFMAEQLDKMIVGLDAADVLKGSESFFS